MNIDYEKIRNLLERVTSGNAGEVYVNFQDNGKLCTITWKRPLGLIEHESYKSRAEILLYVRDLLWEAGLGVIIHWDITQEDFLPED